MATTVERRAEGHLPRPSARIFYWGMPLVWILIVSISLPRSLDQIARDALVLIPWFVVVAITNLLPVPGWQSTSLATDLPIAVACGLIFAPIEVGLVSFLGVFDAKEFQGRISPEKALFNRSQVGFESYVGSLFVHSLTGSPARSALILPLALGSLAVATSINYVLVSLAISLEHGYGFRDVASRLRLGTPWDFVLTFASWAVLGAMLAALYDQSHPWALFAFLAPTLMARQTLMRSQMFIDTKRAYRSRERVLAALSDHIYSERTDERRLIAADLHDEVVQPLYKVTLMANVLKADLATGRLLELDADLPELLAAAEATSASLRHLIGDLRRSPLGRGGLSLALASLVRMTQRQTSTRVRCSIDEVDLRPNVQLALYQIAKEALSNAVAHARATEISLELTSQESVVRLSIIDDGIGFDTFTQAEGHYGIEIMRERAAPMGCDLMIDSLPGKGTKVELSFPINETHK